MLWFSRRFAALFSIVIATVIILGQAHAESPEFTLRGKVLDPNQAPIVGAQISASPDGSPSSYSTVSNTFGEFSLLLKPGHYTVHIFANGFEETSKAISIATGATEYLEIGLQIAAPHDTITVVGTDYLEPAISSATRTLTPLRDTPQSITVV